MMADYSVLYPETANEASEIIKCGTPIAPAGGLSRFRLRPPKEGKSELISTAHLPKTIEIEPGNLLMRAGAGLTVGEVAEALEKAGLYWPVSGPHLYERTLGAIMAEGAVGLETMGRGRMIDWILGATFVEPGGGVIKSGGRTLKDVSGYDLTRLHWRSWGRLGLCLEFILKLIPQVPSRVAVALNVAEAEEGVQEARKLILEKWSPESLRLVYEAGQGWRLLAAWSGFPELTEARVKAFKNLAGDRPLETRHGKEINWGAWLGSWPLEGPGFHVVSGHRRDIIQLSVDLNCPQYKPGLIRADLDIGGGRAIFENSSEKFPANAALSPEGPEPGDETFRRLKTAVDPKNRFGPVWA